MLPGNVPLQTSLEGDRELSKLMQGWLSPSGEFTICEGYDHYEQALRIIGQMPSWLFNNPEHRKGADDELLGAGWVRISISIFQRHEWVIAWDLRKYLTPEQIRFLRPYFEESEIPVSEPDLYRWKQETEGQDVRGA